MNIKIFDSNRKEFLPLDCLGWRLRDIFNQPLYDNIQVVFGTGLYCYVWSKKDSVDKQYVLTEVFEGDIINVIGDDCVFQETVVWDENRCGFGLKNNAGDIRRIFVSQFGEKSQYEITGNIYEEN